MKQFGMDGGGRGYQDLQGYSERWGGGGALQPFLNQKKRFGPEFIEIPKLLFITLVRMPMYQYTVILNILNNQIYKWCNITI